MSEEIVSCTPEPVVQCLGWELWAGSVSPRLSWISYVTLFLMVFCYEEQKSKMQLVNLFRQLLNVLNIILLLLAFLIYGATTVIAAMQQKSLWNYIYYVSKTSVIPSRLGQNEGIYFTDKILTTALASSGKPSFQTFWKTEDGEIGQEVTGIKWDIEEKRTGAWLRQKGFAISRYWLCLARVK